MRRNMSKVKKYDYWLLCCLAFLKKQILSQWLVSKDKVVMPLFSSIHISTFTTINNTREKECEVSSHFFVFTAYIHVMYCCKYFLSLQIKSFLTTSSPLLNVYIVFTHSLLLIMQSVIFNMQYFPTQNTVYIFLRQHPFYILWHPIINDNISKAFTLLPVSQHNLHNDKIRG